MKVIVEYNSAFEAKIGLQAPDLLQFIEDFENFLENGDSRPTRDFLLDKFNALKDLYKI